MPMGAGGKPDQAGLGGAARQLQEPATQEEDRTPVRPAAELAVARQPQRVAVEHLAALRVSSTRLLNTSMPP